MLAYCKLFEHIRAAGLLSDHSPKDIIELSKSIYKVKIHDQWRLAEVTAKTRKLLAKLDIDYLKRACARNPKK
jgi:hypothetical protein